MKKYFQLIVILVSFPVFSSFNKGFAQTVPTPDHIVIVIMENYGYNVVINQAAAPYINSLIGSSYTAFITNAYGVEHPSQPNYIDLFSCGNQGVTDDNIPSGIPFTTKNLGYELINNGHTFKTYSEDLPSVGYNGGSSGNYARKHNPGANWMGTGLNQIPTTTNQPLTAFPTNAAGFASLPTVSFLVPNQVNDMHNPGVATGDSWLQNTAAIQNYITWCKTNNSLFILMWDENLQDGSGAGSNHVPLFVIGQKVVSGTYVEPTNINHYNLLRTIQVMYGLTAPCGNGIAYIQDIWDIAASLNQQCNPQKNNTEYLYKDENEVTIFPSPFCQYSLIQFKFNPKDNQEEPVSIEVQNAKGEKIFSGKQLAIFQTSGIAQIIIKSEDLNNQPGTYLVKAVFGNRIISSKIILEPK